jgi:hypothetical protein
MKTSTFIALSFSFTPLIFAAEPPKPSQMHLIDRSRIQTNTPPAYRASVGYDVIVIRRDHVRSAYVPSRR